MERVTRQIAGVSPDGDPAQCREAIDTWNQMIDIWRLEEPSPYVGVALAAGFRWLDLYCRACRQITTVDIERLNLHPQTRLANVTLRWRCSCGCGADGPPGRIRCIKDQPPGRASQWPRHGRGGAA